MSWGLKAEHRFKVIFVHNLKNTFKVTILFEMYEILISKQFVW